MVTANERGRRRPVEEPQDSRDGEPDEGCRGYAEYDAMALRERGIAQRKDRNRRVRGHAADRAGGDECGRVFQRQDDVGRAGDGRQRGDERGHQRPAPLGGNRHGDDHCGSHHRLEGQSIPKERIGQHPTSESDMPATQAWSDHQRGGDAQSCRVDRAAATGSPACADDGVDRIKRDRASPRWAVRF